MWITWLESEEELGEVQVSSACEPEVSSDVGEDINFEYDNESEFSCGDDNNRCELVDVVGLESEEELEVSSACEPEVVGEDINFEYDNESEFSCGDDNYNSVIHQFSTTLDVWVIISRTVHSLDSGQSSYDSIFIRPSLFYF